MHDPEMGSRKPGTFVSRGWHRLFIMRSQTCEPQTAGIPSVFEHFPKSAHGGEFQKRENGRRTDIYVYNISNNIAFVSLVPHSSTLRSMTQTPNKDSRRHLARNNESWVLAVVLLDCGRESRTVRRQPLKALLFIASRPSRVGATKTRSNKKKHYATSALKWFLMEAANDPTET